jgi:predicted acetyltransferase
VRLVQASLDAPAGLAEFLAAARADDWLNHSDLPSLDRGLGAFLQRHVDLSQGRNLPAGWVPATTFWLLDDNYHVVAMSNLRHQLNDFLRHHGGHIGYYVAPAQRGLGYGTQILALTLPHARSLGIERALLTVDSDNEPSIRVIERNGGVLEDETIDSTTRKLHRRYWIDLTAA